MSGVEPPDLGSPRRIHLVAIGGSGMSAIATVLVQQGHSVRGSDLVGGETVDRLRSFGVEVHVGHDAAHLGDAELVVASTAVPAENPELVEARRRDLPVLRRYDVLRALARRQPLLSVSGTHGKTTTSSMLATVLHAAGADPSFIVGAEVVGLGAAGAGAGPNLVLEADESDASFLAGPRAGAVVTNVEPDHLEFWGGWEQLVRGFAEFVEDTDGPVVVCADDPGAAVFAGRRGVVTYGAEPSADYLVRSLVTSSGGSRVVLAAPGGDLGLEVRVPGRHNALNAVAAAALAMELGVDPSVVVAGIDAYSGTARRFEPRGSVGGIDFVDDYAHLPTEVRAAVEAGRGGEWRRVVVVFQPHRYSRTEALWSEFAGAFAGSDVLVLTEIYPAGEAPRAGVSGRLLVDAVRGGGGPEPIWCPGLDDAASRLADLLEPGDLCLTLGAGDVTSLADRVIERLEGAGR